jgi:dTDP-4-amino-4,6-dideoxygalactose transaminase
MIRGALTMARLLAAPKIIGYVGGTTWARDALDLWRRYRRGEPVLDGPHIAEYEAALRAYFGGHQAVTFSAGRMALYAILRGMFGSQGGEVVTPGYTCIVTPNAIRYAGMTPVYVDVSPRDFNMTVENVQAAITPRTQTIVLQHTFGVPCNVDAFMDLSRRTGIPIIEDCAHAFGARWRGRLLGRFGHAAFYSTEGSKMFSTERGGVALTADADLAVRLQAIQQESPFADEALERYAVKRWCYRAAFCGNPWIYPRAQAVESVLRWLGVSEVCNMVGYSDAMYQKEVAGERFSPYPSRLPNLMGYVGLIQLRRLDADVAHRQALAHRLEQALPELGARVAKYPHNLAAPSWVRFPFIPPDRERWRTCIARAGFVPGVWLDDPIHPKGSNWEAAGYRRGQCPVAEALARDILNVPVHRRVAPHALEHLLQRLAAACGADV